MKVKLKPWVKRISKIGVLIAILFGLSTSTIFSSNSLNLDRFDVKVGLLASAVKNEEEKPKPVEKPIIRASTPTSYETNNNVNVPDDGLIHGSMTGYSADCALCGGRLACTQYDVYRNGVVTYPDGTYGNVRIVASSRNLPCGSIVAINSSLTSEPMVAIVLDRGVGGNNLDLLVASEAEAYNNIGRKSVSYSILRSGW